MPRGCLKRASSANRREAAMMHSAGLQQLPSSAVLWVYVINAEFSFCLRKYDFSLKLPGN